jgi:hypothetical protein
VFAGGVVVPAIAGFLNFTEPQDVVWIRPSSISSETCDKVRFNQSFEDLTQQVQYADNYLCEPALLQAVGIDECTCSNPFVGVPMLNTKDYPAISDRWSHTFELQKELMAKSSALSSLEVAFLGDSISEHWLGWSLGDPLTKFENISRKFNSPTSDIHNRRLSLVGSHMVGYC